MTIDEDLREELIEYFEKEVSDHPATIAPIILFSLQNGIPDAKQVYDYLARDFDINWEGGPNEPMRLAGAMTFQDDCNYWKPLHDGEKSAGLLDPPDPDIIDEHGRKR